jgi:hypothetical protein
LLRFTRTISVKHHRTGDHYSLSIPPQVAQALGLQDGGSLVSIEILNKLNTHKKEVVLKSYRDSDFAWREQFDPSGPHFKPVAIPPRTLGPSKPWGCGQVLDMQAELKDARAVIRWLRVAFPYRRRRRRRR